MLTSVFAVDVDRLEILALFSFGGANFAGRVRNQDPKRAGWRNLTQDTDPHPDLIALPNSVGQKGDASLAFPCSAPALAYDLKTYCM